MKISRPVWLAAALAGAVGASGFVWLPVPIGMVEQALAEREPGFTLDGEARLRWASGEVRATGLRLGWSGRSLAEAAEVTLALDLRPWSESFGAPWRVIVSEFAVSLDARALDALAGLRQEPAQPVSIEVAARDGRLEWTLPTGERIAARLEHGRALVRTGSARESETAAEAVLHFESPTAGEARLRLRAVEGGAFEASAVANGARLQELARFAPGLGGLEGGISAEAHLHLGAGMPQLADFLRVRLSAEAAAPRHPSLPIALDEVRFQARGDLRRALSWEGSVASARGRLAAEGALLRTDGRPDGVGSWNCEAQARLEECALDEALKQELAELAPEALEIFAALGLRGSARARAGFRGELSAAGVRDGWELAVTAPLQGLGVDYAGFPDEQGKVFSFPYPIAVTGGVAGWSGGAVLVAAEAVAGEAQGDPHGEVQQPTRIEARCAVAIEARGAKIWLDLAGRAVRLDGSVGAALQANPETGALWFQLGAPRGEADVDLSLRPAPDGKTDWSVKLSGRDLVAEPPDAGMVLHCPQASAQIDAGGVRFSAEIRTEAAQARARGRVRARAGREDSAELSLTADGSGYLAPAEREALALLYLLPQEFVQIDPGCAPDWTVSTRLLLDRGTSPPLQGLVDLRLRDAAPAWPQRNAGGSGWSVRAAAVLTPDETLLAVEPAEGNWQESRLLIGGAARIPSGAGSAGTPIRGSVTASLFESAISQSEVHAALLLIDSDAWAAGLRFAGKVAATVEVPLADPSALRARLDLNPLQVIVQPGALGPTAMREPARYTMTGALRLLDGAVSTQRLGLRSADLDLVLEQASGRLDESGLAFSGIAVSQRGVLLRPQLEVVAPARVLASLDRIGLDGRIAPKGVRLEVQWPAGGIPRATASGALALSDFEVDGPPPVRGGDGNLIFEEFVWNGPEDFHGSFRLEGGSAVVSGVKLRDARARVELLPDRVVVTDFEAKALDGRVFTQLTETDGAPHAGMFSLGLTGQAPLRADFGFEGFLLERMGEELGYRGPLAGRLDGRVDVRSSDPSPVNYRGGVRLHITDGVLGAVPVLSQIWQLLGVKAPVFNEGRLALQFLSEGRILVEELALLHTLLEVTGERVITLDSYLGLKVTVRTLGLLGRLPLVRDLMDLIVEQDVYGPASAPRLRQRGLGKLFQGELEKVKFPLWVPRTPMPDRTRAPVLPAERVLTARP